MRDKNHTLADDIASSGHVVSSELSEALRASREAEPERGTAYGSVHEDTTEEDDPCSGAFFEAMNAYRKARATGDAEAQQKAQEHLQAVVRAELTGTDSPCSE